MKDIVIYIALAIELLFIGYLFYCAYYVHRTPMYKPKKEKRRKTMIEELEHPYIDLNNGSGYMYDMGMVIEKINEIIRYLNKMEEKNEK